MVQVVVVSPSRPLLGQAVSPVTVDPTVPLVRVVRVVVITTILPIPRSLLIVQIILIDAVAISVPVVRGEWEIWAAGVVQVGRLCRY